MLSFKVRYVLPNGNKRSYKVNKVMDCARKLMIPDLNETVEQYFKVGEVLWPVDMI